MELSFELAPMLDASVIEAGLRQLPPQQLRTALADFLSQAATAEDRISAIEGVLRSPPANPCGTRWRGGLSTRLFRWRGWFRRLT